MPDLSGKRIAFITAQVGVEKVELQSPWQAITDAGGTAVLIAPESGEVQSMVGDVDKDETFSVDVAIGNASASDFDALVLPGGTVNADKARSNGDVVALVNDFISAQKPIAAICHAPWTLVETGALRGKTLTSYPSLQTDIKNAGGDWRDVEVFHCPTNDWDLITSRSPDDLEAFNAKLLEVFAAK